MTQNLTHDFCELSLQPKYAILRVFENIYVDEDKTSIIRNSLKSFYRNKPFVMITDRKYDHKIDPAVYKSRSLKNMIALAIVSEHSDGREKATDEQPMFEDSFAFFNNVESAIDWAESFFARKS